jgi:2-oxoglutarate dehydrogenase E1 component
VWNLIDAYRHKAHLISKTNPIRERIDRGANLDLEELGLSKDDLDEEFHAGEALGLGKTSLQNILDHLDKIYCRSIGFEYMHVINKEEHEWLQNKIEKEGPGIDFPIEKKKHILKKLNETVVFEKFLNTKYIGQKRFSLEGGETTIPALDHIINTSAEEGMEETVIGMAHRGRLNVLANLLGKTYEQIFSEFEGDIDPDLTMGDGDVKYHLGYSAEIKAGDDKKTINVKVAPNPSHLEAVSPVVSGYVRSKSDVLYDSDWSRVMPIIMHGDAAVAGQGIVYEMLQMSQLKGFHVGGTLHFVINNQIGFTTAPAEGRSSVYATDVAKMLQAPIFHVNGEDPEAVAQVVQLAMDFRWSFKRDVFIDMYGYRRLGHNEGDEPSFTQPVLYRAISKRKPVREGYLDHLLQLNEITRAEADEIAERRREHLEKELTTARSEDYLPPKEKVQGIWSRSHFVGGRESNVEEAATGVSRKVLQSILNSQTRLPNDFHPHPKINKLLQNRADMAEGKSPLDWASAEALAFGSLALEGVPVRLTGQDCARGTFSHRHAVLYDHRDGHPYLPLQHLAPDQAALDIFNSPLSETGVLGFDYGYSLDCPDGLILWEAQFGDFVNAAQVIIDQFLASAEDKWRRLSGLVLLLPHGFEGQGPEHSSARLERFLTLAAEDNIQVVSPSTPAQYFHCLRRQVLRPWRKPLIIMTPKSLLRHPKVVSSLDECAAGAFQRPLPDPLDPPP